MEIRILEDKVIRTEEFYQDFLADRIKDKEEYFTTETVLLKEAPDFPIYLNYREEGERKCKFHEALDIITKYYINTDRDIHMNDMFWYSLFCVYKREYLLEEYPEIVDSMGKFQNIVLKKFDWENYIYKCILASQYVTDEFEAEEDRKKYFDLIIENLDLYNYIIKYEIFRNDQFLINILKIVDKYDLGEILKKKLKGRDDLGKDERVGRRVIYELNKMYPVVISPAMEVKDLEELFMEQLGKYWSE